MRIISKEKDYYDTVQSMGYDPNVCFVRKPEEIEGEFFSDALFMHNSSKHEKDMGYDFTLIGFCGEIYVCLTIEYSEDSNFYNCYSIEDVDKVMDKFLDKKIKKFYYEGDRKSYYSRSPYYREYLKQLFTHDFLITPTMVARYLFSTNKYLNYHNVVKIFMDKKAPIFTIGKKNRKARQKLTLNPILKDFGFQKIKDPYTAYQEIAQYISGVIGIGHPETVEISDKDQRDKKGFDEWSFKKMPEEKK